MFFGLVLHMYVFFSLIFLSHDFPCIHFVNHPPITFLMVPLSKIILLCYINSLLYFFFSQLALCQLKTLQTLNTNHMYIWSQHLLITLEDVALQC